VQTPLSIPVFISGRVRKSGSSISSWFLLEDEPKATLIECDKHERSRPWGRADGNRSTVLSSSVLLKLYIYGYLNRVQSSHRLEREAGLNVEVMGLLCRLAPDHKAIADFRKGQRLGASQGLSVFVAPQRSLEGRRRPV